MKVAVLVYGEYREFDSVVDSWKIFNDLDCDFYFSIWNTSKQNNNSLGIKREFDVTPEMILKHYPNAIVDIKNPNDIIEYKPSWGNTQRIYFHWKNCVKLLDSSSEKYDFILIIRPDVYYVVEDLDNEFPNKIINKLHNTNSLFVHGGYNEEAKMFYPADHFILGPYDVIKKLLIDSQYFDGNIHEAIGLYLIIKNVTVIQNEIIVPELARPNSVLYLYNGEFVQKNITQELLNDKKYFYNKRVEWDNSLINKPFSD